MRRRIAVIGGGPAGLMAAALLARDHADWEVTVYERLAPDDTFGFGVGLTGGLLAALRDASPVVHDELVAASTNFSSAAFRLPGGVVELPSFHAGAISRARMLQLLLDRARHEGVGVNIGASPSLDDVRDDADLVIAADGVSSATREQLVDELGVREESGRGLFIWCGAEVALEGTIFMPVRTADGTFVAHAYPYANGRSTFVIETDAATLERAGCRTNAFTHEGDSDDASLGYLSAAFAELLGGGSFVGNRSRWMHFRTVRCARWHHGNVILLGDAAATVHPSLGSGTKLALEGAIALAASMESIGTDAPAARLPDFERSVRANVERLQERARRSQLWWESFPSRLDLTPARLAFAYMSRAGAVSLEQMHKVAPDLAGQAAADYAGVAAADVPAGELDDWVLHRPLQINGRALPARIVSSEWAQSDPHMEVMINDPWGAEAQVLLHRVAGLAGGPAAGVTLTGPGSRDALLDRLALGERIRAELGARVAVTCAERLLADVVDGLVAGRTDLVEVGGR
jgi:2-polyprenyl-6-methoxyphenol hydroxylase-like FAD-dependent oxidoreductase